MAAVPAAAVLEVSGAVLAWTVDDPEGPTQVTFTDVTKADWLWLVVGAQGHVALQRALAGEPPEPGRSLDVPGVELSSEALAPLRRLAIGHWLRRWWPASARDGIVALDPVLLDGELALSTSAAQDYFTDDTFDSDVAELVRPHRSALAARAASDDPRVAELARACVELADDLGVAQSALVLQGEAELRRDQYALAAGSDQSRSPTQPIARGVGSVDWTAVPPGLFDAADSTIDWAIELAGSAAVAAVRVAAHAPVAGIEVRLRSGGVSGIGVLDDDGRAELPLLGASRERITESQAWNHDWPATTVTVGADVAAMADAAATRARLRDFARTRLTQPNGDAFLAEVLAAEFDY